MYLRSLTANVYVKPTTAITVYDSPASADRRKPLRVTTSPTSRVCLQGGGGLASGPR